MSNGHRSKSVDISPELERTSPSALQHVAKFGYILQPAARSSAFPRQSGDIPVLPRNTPSNGGTHAEEPPLKTRQSGNTGVHSMVTPTHRSTTTEHAIEGHARNTKDPRSHLRSHTPTKTMKDSTMHELSLCA